MDIQKKVIEILRKIQRNKCYFFQEKECVLHNYFCIFCSSYTRKIKGLDNTKDYLLMIGNRKVAIRALFFSAMSLIISILVMFKDIIVPIVQKKIQ